MPPFSEKKRLEFDLFAKWVASWVQDEDDNETMQWFVMHEAVKEQRYLYPRDPVPKSNVLVLLLNRFKDEKFRSFARMNRSSFRAVYRLLCDDPIFTNNSNNPQAPVESQLLYALYKLGHEGNASGFLKSAIH